NVAAHRGHAAISACDNFLFWHEFHDLADDLCHLLWSLDLVGCHVDHTDEHVLAVEKRQQLERNVRIDALDRNLADPAFADRWKNLLILPPFAAERVFPIDVGFNAVAVTDVHGGGAFEAIDGPM